MPENDGKILYLLSAFWNMCNVQDTIQKVLIFFFEVYQSSICRYSIERAHLLQQIASLNCNLSVKRHAETSLQLSE